MQEIYKAGLFEHRVTGHQFPMVSHVPKIADDDRQEIVCARYKTLELLRWDGTARGGQLSHGWSVKPCEAAKVARLKILPWGVGILGTI